MIPACGFAREESRSWKTRKEFKTTGTACRVKYIFILLSASRKIYTHKYSINIMPDSVQYARCSGETLKSGREKKFFMHTVWCQRPFSSWSDFDESSTELSQLLACCSPRTDYLYHQRIFVPTYTKIK